MLERKGIGACVTSGWWQCFCRRHPNLTLRAPASLSKARHNASDPEIVKRYFDLLEQTMVENDLLDKPGQIFNVDESGMPLNPKPVKCVFNRGIKDPLAPSFGDKSQITIVGCIRASGGCTPPMVILDRKTLPQYFTVGEVPGTIYGLSSRGWIDQELFDVWFTNHFLRYAPLARPLLLLLDGHSSHYCPDTIRLTAKERVIVFALPPHTTHFSQLLDKSCFGLLKSHWRVECHCYMSSNPGHVVSRYNFSTLFSAAWMKAMTIADTVGGFKTTGVFPLNREAVQLPKDNMERLNEQSGLSFIPLYTPSKSRKSVHEAEFSCEEMRKNQIRFESGYDVPSERYEAWVRRFHPELHVLMHDTSSCSAPQSLSNVEDHDASFSFSSDVDGEVQGRLFLRLLHLSLSSDPASISGPQAHHRVSRRRSSCSMSQ